LTAQLLARDADIEFTIANSVWHDRAFPVKSPFLDAARTYFNAEVRPIDFRDATAPKTISDWAERATNGRIKDIIKELDPDEVMALINAIYFKALWQNQFITGDTRNRPFTRADGSTVTVPLMSKRAQFAAVRTADVIAAELPYANGAFSMLLVAPASGHSLAAVEAKMTPSWWKSLVDEVAAHKGDAVVTLPKFTFQYGLTLNEVLAALGMGIAMEIFRADFSRIKDPPPGLYISRVEHKTFIAVTEKGTEAGAVTITLIVPDSAPPEFVFDRPFVFAIREKSSGAILFIGRVSDPTP
jgi:serpin B